MKTKNTALRRLVAGAGALTIAMAGVVASGTAFADTNVGPDQPGAPETGTLTINKYKGGHTETPAEADLLDGVEFTVTQVGRTVDEVCTPVDLTDAAQWDGLEDLFDSAPAAPAGDFCLTNVVQDGDTEDGSVTFTLDVGIYFVQETDPGEHNIVSPVPNFYVSIPTSLGEEGDGWNYNVVADPKNQIMDAPSKTIEEGQEGLVVGSDVTWNLEIPIPTLNNEETFDSASVTDVLDDRLDYSSSTLAIGDTDLEEGVHYTVDSDGVTWTFTEDGLLQLDKAMGETLFITLITAVESVGDGSIPNDEYSSKFNGTEVPGGDEPYTYWGQLSILKVDDSAPALPLAGAEFQVFLPNDLGACEEPGAVADAIAIGTSDDDGVVQWEGVDPTNPLGLWIGNYDTQQTEPSKDYCVYETVVPAGHTLVPFTNLVNITPGELAEGTFTLTVENAKKDGPDLPLTGAAGTVALMTGGVLLLGAGAAVMVTARRRRIMEV